MATATSRNTEASAGAWSTATNVVQDVSDAIAELEADGHNGPYDLICRSDARADLRLLIANTGIMAQEKIQQMLGPGGRIWTSDNLYTSAGATTSALVVEPNPLNFALGIAQDVSVYNCQDSDMNTLGKVWEIVAPMTPPHKRLRNHRNHTVSSHSSTSFFLFFQISAKKKLLHVV